MLCLLSATWARSGDTVPDRVLDAVPHSFGDDDMAQIWTASVEAIEETSVDELETGFDDMMATLGRKVSSV